MSNGKIPENILNKLKSLLNFKADAIRRDSIHEIENAAARINEILLKYNLELEELEFKDKEKLTKEDILYVQKKNENDWTKLLWGVIAKYNLCTVVSSSRRNDKGECYVAIYLIGKEVNREIVKYTVDAIINEIRNVEPHYWVLYNGFDKRNAFRRAFFLGCVRGINAKLQEEQNAFLRNEVKITALVRTNEVELANQLKIFFPKAQTILRQRKATATDGLRAGYAYGRNMDIKKGINTSNQKRIGE